MTPAILVVGAGPAGIAAALAARALGAEVSLLEAGNAPGGQLHRVYSPVTGLEGFAGDGAALAAAWSAELDRAGIRVRTGTRVESLVRDPAGGATLRLTGGESLRAAAVLIASGLAPRRLGVPGETEFAGRGVSTSATRDRAAFAGRPVVVAGGGDAAFENALLLAAVGCEVRLLVRGTPRAREEFRRRVAAEPRVAVETGVRVVAILGDDRVGGVRVAGDGAERTIAAEAVFVKAGAEPVTAWCRGAVALDASGYVRAGDAGRTDAAGIHAAGDVLGPPEFTLARAIHSARAAVSALFGSEPGGA